MDLRRALRPVKRRVDALVYREPRPSFCYKLAELERVKALAIFEYMRLTDKTRGKKLAAELGIRVPEILTAAPSVDAIPWDDLPDEFVVKPRVGSASRGVHLLGKGPAGLTDLVTGAAITRQAIADDIRTLAASPTSHTDDVVVEELIRSSDGSVGAPDDWKFYTFRGEVGLILQRRRHRSGAATVRFYDPEWRPLGNIRAYTRVDPSLGPPRRTQELLDAASRMSAAIPAPFVRIDLYDALDGVVFGEITPAPGGPQWFDRHWDRTLGEMWEQAEARLAIAEGDAVART